MPIFISYSQADKEFVDELAKNLVLMKHHVWVDRWELKVGDSLTERVQTALTQSSAVIVVLSKNSIDSLWCKRELNAVLVREIEERRSIILPCRIDDSELPLFLRDKLYADFRNNPDKALNDIDAALSAISNPFQSRFEEPDFVTDWAVDWLTDSDGDEVVKFHFVDHGESYVIVSTCTVICNETAGKKFKKEREGGSAEKYIQHILQLIEENLATSPLNPPPIIKDQFEQFVAWVVEAVDEMFFIHFSYRRMGKDTGFDTVVHLDNNIRQARQHMREVGFSPDET